MSLLPITHITIVGGGTAGWMAAAALSKVLPPHYRIRLIESDEIGTIGVGEATIPMIKLYNNALDLDEAEFLRETNGSFKLGIEFVDWGKLGHSYIHGFGTIGQDLGLVPFHHYWLKQRHAGKAAELDAYSINTWACRHNRFIHPMAYRQGSPLSQIAYAYHFDASLYAKFLRRFAEARGVQRIEGKIVDVALHPESGDVSHVATDRGDRIDGQLFIDCSGFRGLLIEQALQTGYEGWNEWLPCDRAVAVPCEGGAEITPYTRSTARTSGWQWRIPLQHRIGNGHVFCSRFISDDEATAQLLAHLDGAPLAEPRVLRFTAGKRKRAWNRNVIAIGLAGGFVEPLESTSIHMIQTAIARLTAFFPHEGIQRIDVDTFNRHVDEEFVSIRDFLIAHYHVTQRDDTPFWDHCRTMQVPESVQRKLDLFASNGRVFRENNELFAEPSWIQTLYGQGLHPAGYHGLVDAVPEERIAAFLENIRGVVDNCVQAMPGHRAYIERLLG